MGEAHLIGFFTMPSTDTIHGLAGLKFFELTAGSPFRPQTRRSYCRT